MYYEAKKETLIWLYRHTLLTADQLAVSLHYRPKTIYNLISQMRKKGLIKSVLLPFLKRHHVGYTLTTKGARAGASLVGDETLFRAKMWEAGPVQLEHYYGTNAFFTDLVAHSDGNDGEGLIEWLDSRSAAERYVQIKANGQKTMPVKPDGFGMYRFPGKGRLALHLEYDTGTETLWRLKEKLVQYGELLPKIWPRVEAVHVLFVMKVPSRCKALIEMWEALCQGSLGDESLPNVYVISEEQWKQGLGNAAWLGSDGKRLTMQEMPLLPELNHYEETPIGKQHRDAPPPVRR